MGGISEEEAVLPVEKEEGIEKAVVRCVGVGEEEAPGLAAVGGFVEAGEVALAAGHDDGVVFVPALDAAEVEVFCAGRHVAGLPEVAAVFAAEDRAVGAAGPDDAAADVVDAAEAGGGVGVFEVPLGLGLSGESCDCQDRGEAQEGEDIFPGFAGAMRD